MGVFIYWYLQYDWADDSHTLISFFQLSHWKECPKWTDFQAHSEFQEFRLKDCSYFTVGKKKASTLSLTVLVTIEMFNALNALSENNSLLDIGIFDNIWLIAAIVMSMIMHAFILYIPGFQLVFQTTPLSWNDWMLVIGFSFPVILIDEFMKYLAKKYNLSHNYKYMASKKD